MKKYKQKKRRLKSFNIADFQRFLPVVKYLFFGIIVVVLILYFAQFKPSRYFPIKTVKVFGISHMKQDDVLYLIEPYVKQGFFSVDVDEVREELVELPWVSKVFVRRQWPNEVDVTIVEKNAVALWMNDTLLSDQGELFKPDRDTYPPGLPYFKGGEQTQNEVLKNYDTMNHVLAPLQSKIVFLELTPLLEWKIVLDNGIELRLDSNDPLTRLNHFVKVYAKVVGNRVKEVEYIDLRYANGIAVRFKNDSKRTGAFHG